MAWRPVASNSAVSNPAVDATGVRHAMRPGMFHRPWIHARPATRPGDDGDSDSDRSRSDFELRLDLLQLVPCHREVRAPLVESEVEKESVPPVGLKQTDEVVLPA